MTLVQFQQTWLESESERLQSEAAAQETTQEFQSLLTSSPVTFLERWWWALGLLVAFLLIRKE